MFGLDWPGVRINAATFNFLGWSPDQTLAPYYGVDSQGPFAFLKLPPGPVEVIFNLTYPDSLVPFPSITTYVSLSAGELRDLRRIRLQRLDGQGH